MEAWPPLQAATRRNQSGKSIKDNAFLTTPSPSTGATLQNENSKPDADTINAIVNALGAVVFATVRQLPAAQQTAFASDLARLAKNEEKGGRLASETLLLDLHRAAVAAAS